MARNKRRPSSCPKGPKPRSWADGRQERSYCFRVGQHRPPAAWGPLESLHIHLVTQPLPAPTVPSVIARLISEVAWVLACHFYPLKDCIYRRYLDSWHSRNLRRETPTRDPLRSTNPPFSCLSALKASPGAPRTSRVRSERPDLKALQQGPRLQGFAAGAPVRKTSPEAPPPPCRVPDVDCMDPGRRPARKEPLVLSDCKSTIHKIYPLTHFSNLVSALDSRLDGCPNTVCRYWLSGGVSIY